MRLLAHRALVASVSPVTKTVGRSNVLRLLLMLVRASALVALSTSLVLLLLASSSLPAPLVMSLVGWLRLLMARIELIADTAVLHARADYVGEPVVVALHFQRVGDDRLNPVVVSHHLDLIDDAKCRVS